MKKIINRKLYDTETATFIGADSYGFPRDFRYWHEELYMNNSGEFFVYGEGGPLSEYAVSVGSNETSGSEKIRLLSKDEAIEWGENHLDPDIFLEYFSEYIEK